MSIKPETGEAAADVVWPGGVLQVEGRDAGSFLQAQLMNDLRPLGVGDWQWTGWLNAKGRVVALAALLRRGDAEFWLILPDYPAARLADELRRYVLRSKALLTARSDLAICGARAGTSELGGADQVRLMLGGDRPRYLEIGPHPRPVSDSVRASTWAVEDLAHGLPRLPETAAASHTPQMLGLEQLRAFSVKKGCYPGQEIVARTHFLGQAKRALRRLDTPRALPPGLALHAGANSVGEVLCSASDGSRHEALAVLPLEAPAVLVTGDDGTGVKVIDFSPGLGR